jgi:hypothetical protein
MKAKEKRKKLKGKRKTNELGFLRAPERRNLSRKKG